MKKNKGQFMLISAILTGFIVISAASSISKIQSKQFDAESASNIINFLEKEAREIDHSSEIEIGNYKRMVEMTEEYKTRTEYKKEENCFNVAIKTSNGNYDTECIKQGEETSETDSNNALSEKGGNLNGLIFNIDSGTASILPFTENLCIGENCDESPGSCTNFDGNNCKVNLSGDKINGVVKTDQVIASDELCVGKHCPMPEGTTSGYLTGGSTPMKGFLSIRNITSNSGLCMGSNC